MDISNTNMINSSKSSGHHKMSKLKMMCYGFGDLASQFVWTFMGTYLTVFYTDVVGIAPMIVSGIMLVARVLDAVFDPVMGAIAERTKSKWGRFRPYIAFGAPILSFMSVLTFTAPFGNSTPGVVWAILVYLITGLIYSAVNIPYSSLSAVMTDDIFERNQLNAYRSMGMNIGMIVVNSLSSVMMLHFSEGNKVADHRGYLTTAIIYAIIAIPMFLAVFFTSKEVIQPVEEQKNVKVRDTIKNVVGNKYLMILMAIMLIQMTAYMGRIALTTYYVIYCLGAFSLIAILLTIPSIGGAICALFVAPLTKKFGKKYVLTVTLFLQGLGLLVIYFAPFSNITMIIIGTVVFGIFNMGFPITLSMVADCVDYQELKSGVRTDGTAYATYGLATKFGTAVGGSIGLILLAAFGYQANMQQTPATLSGINVVVNLIPALLFILAGIISFNWKLTDEVANEIRVRLDEGIRSKNKD